MYDDRLADDVLQLSDVAGPAAGAEPRLGFRREGTEAAPFLAAEGCEEVPGEQQDVAARSRSGGSSIGKTWSR